LVETSKWKNKKRFQRTKTFNNSFVVVTRKESSLFFDFGKSPFDKEKNIYMKI